MRLITWLAQAPPISVAGVIVRVSYAFTHQSRSSSAGQVVIITVGIELEILGPLAAVRLELQLAWCVGVGVDGEQTAHLDRQFQQPGRRIPSLRTGVDLHGDVEGTAGLEDHLGVENSTPA